MRNRQFLFGAPKLMHVFTLSASATSLVSYNPHSPVPTSNTGHGGLRRAIGLEEAWNFHGEVLLWHILRRWVVGETAQTIVQASARHQKLLKCPPSSVKRRS